MNFGYVAMGLGVAATVTLLALRLEGTRRVLSTVFGWLIAAGMVLVATFHGEAASVDNGTIVLHVLGAAVAILFGNVLAIVTGANAARLGFPRWYSRVAITLGVVGLAGLVLLVSGVTFLDPAVFERISVYSIFAWLLMTSGVQIAINRTRKGSRDE
jgi:hypothetical protein